MKPNIVLTENQWKRISDLLANLGLLMLGSIVIPFFSDFENLIGALWGILITVFLWYLSVYTAKKY